MSEGASSGEGPKPVISFIQMADPQFGSTAALSKVSDEFIAERRKRGIIIRPAPETTGYAAETVLYERAVEAANRLAPDFVVMCGDMVNNPDDPGQIAEMFRITSKLDEGIPVHWVAGNHDLNNEYTANSLAAYRERFGPDYYAFQHRGTSFIVLNSNICFDPSLIPDEWAQQLRYLRDALQAAASAQAAHIIVFMHHPLFGTDPEEEEDAPLILIPKERRSVILDLLQAYGVSAVFAGHWHRNNYARHGRLQMVTTGPVGYPLWYDPSGFRIVRVFEDRIEHEYVLIDAPPPAD